MLLLQNLQKPIKSRLAPTPSGFLHLGNGASFALAWAITRSMEGELLLRIDDMDTERFRQEYLDDIFYTLDWLGLDWDEGPSGPADFDARWSQRHRLPLYGEALVRLQDSGELYVCDCTRKLIKERSPNGIYPGICRERRLPWDSPASNWRVKTEPCSIVTFQDELGQKKILPVGAAAGDFVVFQKNGAPSYQLTSVVDDLHFGVNFIVRGKDLLLSTGIQLFLAGILGHSGFLQTQFFHHPLVQGPTGTKLSKSKGDIALKSWREAGLRPDLVFQTAASWLGITEGNVVKNGQELVQVLND